MQSVRRLAAALLIVSSSALAQTHESVSNILGAGARALGMGGAFTAIADDATAASWNPAGLRILGKPEASLVYDRTRSVQTWNSDAFSTVRSDGSYLRSFDVSDIGTSQATGIGFASVSAPVDIKKRRFVTQLSYRRLISFASFDNPYTYRNVLFDAAGRQVDEIDSSYIFHEDDAGGIDDYALSLATSVVGGLDVGVSINWMQADVSQRSYFADLNRANDREDGWTKYNFSGTHFDVGLLYRHGERFSIGGVYHGGLTADFEHSVEREKFTREGGRSQVFSEKNETKVTWPSSYALGVAYRPVGRFILAADYSSTDWSSATVERLTDFFVAYEGNAYTKHSFIQQNLGFPYLGLQQKDTTSWRMGAEYMVFAPHDVNIPLRVGYFQEDQIINLKGDEQSTFNGFTVGTGIGHRSVQLDFAYARTTGSDVGTVGLDSYEEGVIEDDVQFVSDRFLVSLIIRFD